MRRFLVRSLAVWSLAFVGVACTDKNAEIAEQGRRVTATSKDDATASVVDQGLRFTLGYPGRGWKMLHKSDAAVLVAGAAAGALSDEGVVATLSVRSGAGDAASNLDARVLDLSLTSKKVIARRDTKVGTYPAMQFETTGESAGVALRFAGLVVVRGEHVYELLAWASAATPINAFEPLWTALTLDEGAIEAVALEQPAAPSRQRRDDDVIGPRWSVRNGVWRDFEHRIVVTRPTENWQLRPAPAAITAPAAIPPVNPAEPLLALESGEVRSTITLTEAGEIGVEDAHKQAQQLMRGQLGAESFGSKEGSFGGTTARISEGHIDGTRRARLATANHGELAVSQLVWSPRALAQEEIDAAAGAVALPPALPMVETTTEAYRDHRLGYQLKPPPGWVREDITPPELAPLGSLVRWQLEGRWFAVAAVALHGSVDSRAWMVAFLEQLLREVLAPDARGAAAHQSTTFGERAAVRLTWSAPLMRTDALIVAAESVVYALVAVDHGDAARGLVEGGFSLLP